MMRCIALLLATFAAAASLRAEEPPVSAQTAEQLLKQALAPGDSPARKQLKAASHAELMRRGGDSLRFLMERIDSENVMIGVLAQELVDRLTAAEAVPALTPFIDHPSTNIARSAVFFLGFHRAPELAPRILPLFAQDRLRAAAVRTLGKWQVTNALDAIAGTLGDTNERVRVAAANALRDLRDSRAVTPLLAALGDPVFTVRNTALRALLTYNAAAEPALLAGARDGRPVVRRQAVRGLGFRDSRAAERALRAAQKDPDPAVRRDADQALALQSARQETP